MEEPDKAGVGSVVDMIRLGPIHMIPGNYAHGNGVSGNGATDLADGNPNCDKNVWRGNDFGTANESCINRELADGLRF